MFNFFAKIMNGCAVKDSHAYRERWLLLQLQPSLLHPQHWDVFDRLSCKLSGASDSFIDQQTEMLLINIRRTARHFAQTKMVPTKRKELAKPSHNDHLWLVS